MELEKQCPICHKWHMLELSNWQSRKLYEYNRGNGLIQEIFPELSRVEREFIKSGFCPECQAVLFYNETEAGEIKPVKD